MQGRSRLKVAWLALAVALRLGGVCEGAGQTDARYLDLACEADRSKWPTTPDGIYRPGSVTFRFDTVSRTVSMSERGTLLASTSGAVFSEGAIRWGHGSFGLDTWRQQGLPKDSAFDGTIDRLTGDALVSWEVGTGTSTRRRVFDGRCRAITSTAF